MDPATGPHGTPRKAPAVTAETTEDRLRRELSQSSQAEARESLLREECARLRADNRALKRAEARRLAPPSAALYESASSVRSAAAPPAHASRMRGNPWLTRFIIPVCNDTEESLCKEICLHRYISS